MPVHVILCEESPYDLIKCFSPLFQSFCSHESFVILNLPKFSALV